MRTIKELGEPLVEAGYEPLPITPGEKVPHVLNWTRITIDREKLLSWADRWKEGDYVGLRCGHIIGIDVDIDDADATQVLLDDAHFSLGDAPVRRGKPGRGLLMYRAAAPFPKKRLELVDPHGNEHAIEVLAQGQQFVAYGEHPGSGREYTWEGGEPLTTPVAELPELTEEEINDWMSAVVDLLPEGWTQSGDMLDEEERHLLHFRPERSVDEMTEDQMVEYYALQALGAWVPVVLPSCREYRDGYRVTSKALKRDLQEDLQLSPDVIYDFGEERTRSAVEVVATYQHDGDMQAAKAWLCQQVGIDIGQHATRVEKKRDEQSRLGMWSARIAEASGIDRLQRLADAIGRDAALTPIERDMLAKSWQVRVKECTNMSVSIGAIRKQMAPRTGTQSQESDVDRPDWCEGWYYVTHVDQFYRYGSTQWVSTQGFNALYQREMAPDDDDRRPAAHRVALDTYRLPVVEVGIYAPHLGETFDLSGRLCVNTFMPNSIPEPDAEMTEAGRAAVERVKRHVWHICGRREQVYTALLDWLTYVIRHPGHKVRYAPLIKGIEGDGKTILLQLLAVCLGQPNVRSVTPQVLMSQFNGYAEGVCAVGLEEIRMAGHNRHDAVNAMKPLITNDTVDIHKKGQDSYNAINTVNYLAFTNHADALPISPTDRRWMAVHTPWSSLPEMQTTIGEEATAYFAALHDAINLHGGALRLWMAEREISPAFNPNGPAPATPEKDAMRLADVDDAEELVQEVIRAGAPGVGERVVSTRHLSDAMTADEFDYMQAMEIPTGRSLARILQRLGWSRYAKQVRWDGSPCRVWVRDLREATNESVRLELDRTLGEQEPAEEQIPF